ncbi:hypothetical protein GE21DRAFT_1305764 [Neurospora crassa]|nr:hypothetical protein 8D4.250 [imported] - Neurospora crassa [Neurospora crassa]KHE87779.1 hypothetical protein GE21DRAFT_1305764 [Neurospora crassa]
MPGQGSLCLLAGRRWKTRSDEMALRKTGGKSGRRERRVEVRSKLVKKPWRWCADVLVALAPLVFQACYLLYTGTKNGKLLSGGKDEDLIVDDGDLCCKVDGARLLEEDAARLSKRRCPGFIVGSGKPTAALVAALTVQGLH